MTRGFEITVRMVDERYGPDHELYARHIVMVPNGTTYAAAYASLEREVRMLCERLLVTELRDREERGELFDTYRASRDPEYVAAVQRLLEQGMAPIRPAEPRLR